MRRALLVLGILLIFLASGIPASPAHVVEAHALLARAEPPPNSQLRDPPTQLNLYFTESLEKKFSRVRVVDQNNAEVQDHVDFDPADNTVMHVFLKPLKPGYITVDWQNVSAVDGHAISGSYPLTILNPDGSVPPGSPPSASAQVTGAQAKPPRIVTKAFLLLSAALLTGALAFLFFVPSAMKGAAADRARAALWRRASITALVALVLLVGFGAIDLVLQATELHTNVGTILDTRWGGRWLLRNLALILPAVCVLATVVTGRARNRVVTAAALVGALAYLALTSSVAHAAAGEGAFWATSADFVHLLAASVWIGMLAQVVMLFVWARHVEREERYAVLSSAMRRFSLIASLSVALLLFTGTVSAVIELEHFSDLLNSGYGRALLIKLLLLVPLLAVGAVNAYVLRPDLEDATEIASLRNRMTILEDLEAQLSKLVRWELGLAIAVLAVVGLLTQTTPTRGSVNSAQSGGKFIANNDSGDIGVTLVVDPNEPGQNNYEVYLTGAVETVESVRLDFQPQGKPDQEARLDLDASNPPTFYVGAGAYLATAGKWQIAVDIRRNQASDLSLPFKVNVFAPGGTVVKAGGDFASPLTFDALSLALLAGAAVLSVGLFVGGLARPGLPAGYLGEIVGTTADRINIGRIRPVWSLGVLIFIGVGMGLVLGSHFDGKPLSKNAATKGNPVKSTPESIARGGVLFSQNCVICHGESGRGDGPAAAGLRIPPANLYLHVPYHPDEFFFGVMTNGLGGVMPSFKATIDDTDRWNILNYLRSRFGETPATE